MTLKKMKLSHLKLTKIIEIRFSELDPMGVVWHGNYVKYLEDVREAFGEKFGLSYIDVFENGYMTPIVKLDIDYKHSVKYGEKIAVEINFADSKAAKLVFFYKIRNAETNEILAEAATIQVLVDKNMELQLMAPEFLKEWKQKVGLLNNVE